MIVGVDLGLKRVGVAIAEAGVVLPLTTLTWAAPEHRRVAKQLAHLIEERSATTLVVGSPRGVDGEETERERSFAPLLQAITDALPTGVDLVRWPENHSTIDGRLEFPHADRDSAAAAIILQDYLENLA